MNRSTRIALLIYIVIGLLQVATYEVWHQPISLLTAGIMLGFVGMTLIEALAKRQARR